jgi:hypothetical protein
MARNLKLATLMKANLFIPLQTTFIKMFYPTCAVLVTHIKVA